MSEADALTSGPTITFSLPTSDPGFDLATGSHTINLTRALPTIENTNLTISGPGADKLTVRRSTGGFYGIFTFRGHAEELTISGLTMSNGFSLENGGAISHLVGTGNFIGALTVTDCKISDNVAAKIGGGIFAAAALNVSNCALSNNFAGAPSNSPGFPAGGGGVAAFGLPMNVTNSTFSITSLSQRWRLLGPWQYHEQYVHRQPGWFGRRHCRCRRRGFDW